MKAKLLHIALSNEKKAGFSKKELLKLHIIEELYRYGSKSIPELCKITNMSTPPITRAIDELMADGFVVGEGIGQSSGGRKPNFYSINPNAGYTLGIDICRYNVRYGLFNLHNEPVAEIGSIEEGLDTSADLMATIKQHIVHHIASSGIDAKKLIGIGLALPGLIDINSGISYSYLPSDKPLAQVFEEQLHYPVCIEHDTKAMALGELAFGLAKGKQHVLCLNIGSGIGLSMILDGKLYHGKSGYSGEFGHIPVVQNGQLCQCGKIGCLETVASGKALVNSARKQIEEGATTLISPIVGHDLAKLSNEIILQAALQGDQFSIGLLSKMGEHLGRGMAMLIHLFNPELILLGGEFYKADNYLIDPIQQNLNKFTIPRIKSDVQIMVSTLGNNAGLMGTVSLVMNKVFATK
jgi:glucokinase-like ROK family protein